MKTERQRERRRQIDRGRKRKRERRRQTDRGRKKVRARETEDEGQSDIFTLKEREKKETK